MKFPKLAFLLSLLAVFAGLSVSVAPVEAGDPTGYDLAAAVNAYRAANGYYQLNYNSLVASAAQAHAEWIVSTGQGGHTGAYGEDETVRVSWTGYGGGAEIHCDENWATTSSVEDAVYGYQWSDWTHQEVMLNQWGNKFTDVGGGVAPTGNGSYVFILDVCKVVGQEYDGTLPDNSGSSDSSDPAAAPTADYSNYVYSVTAATPAADGSITHIVLSGQTLETIAKAYGVSVEKLRELNDMAADDSVIWVDQELVINPGTSAQETPTTEGNATADPNAELTPSSTPEEPTATPRPTRTLLPDVATATPGEEEVAKSESLLLRNLGVILVVVCGGGLAAFLVISSRVK